MSDEREPKDKIRGRIKPTLDKVAVKGLWAWLKAIGLSSAAYTRPAITDLVLTKIYEGRLAEGALAAALIGFEEASDMRVYLFSLEEPPRGGILRSLPDRLLSAGFALSSERRFAGDKTKPMSPVYAQLEGDLLRIKWAEQHQHLKLDERTGKVATEDVNRRIVLSADLKENVAELQNEFPGYSPCLRGCNRTNTSGAVLPGLKGEGSGSSGMCINCSRMETCHSEACC